MAAVIGLARAFPWIGCTGGPLKPELTLNKLSIAVVFTLSGLNTSFRELTAAVARWRLNACIQAFTFIVFPSVMFFCLCPMLQLVLPASAIDGLITLACLPSTINMCILMSQAAGADVTCALFNAVCGNLLGVFLTPALIFAFVGRSLHVSFVEAIGKLSRMVLLPLLFGQLLRRTSVLTFAQKHKGSLKIVNEFALLGIVFTTFCDTFIKGFGMSGGELLQLFLCMPLLMGFVMMLSWGLFSASNPKMKMSLRVAALYVSTQKTLAFGLPIIKTLFGSSPSTATVIAPLLIYHPLQLFVGSILAPSFKRMIQHDESESK